MGDLHSLSFPSPISSLLISLSLPSLPLSLPTPFPVLEAGVRVLTLGKFFEILHCCRWVLAHFEMCKIDFCQTTSTGHRITKNYNRLSHLGDLPEWVGFRPPSLPVFWCTVSYVDDCRHDDGTATHLIGESDGYLAVFPRHRTHRPSSRRCPWTLSVNNGRRINITWRVSPTAVRYIPPGVALPLDARSNSGVDEAPCSFKLTFIESGQQPVQWTCHRQDPVPVDRSVQVQFSVTLLVFVPTAVYLWQLCVYKVRMLFMSGSKLLLNKHYVRSIWQRRKGC